MAALGGELRGDPERRVNTVGSLATAGPAALGFLANSRYRSLLSTTRAGCVILREKDASTCQTAAIVTADPYVYYARAAELVLPPTPLKPGIHPEASVGPDAEIAADAWIGPCVVVGAGARIGPCVYLGPGCVVGEGVEIGARTRLSANVTILARAHVGRDCVLHPGVVIGADGFGIALD
ncbi:MAG: LpxD N-terminal domain-containing protein, partial [Terriglobia bacterium]